MPQGECLDRYQAVLQPGGKAESGVGTGCGLAAAVGIVIVLLDNGSRKEPKVCDSAGETISSDV